MKDVVRTTVKYNNNQRNSQGYVPRRKHKRNLTLYYVMVFIIVMSILIVLSLTVFFNINTIVIKGESVYTTEEIMNVLGVKKGENLFRKKMGDIESQVLSNLPEIETVKVQRALPDKLKVTVTPCIPFADIEVDGRYYEISQSFKITKEVSALDENLLHINGLDPESSEIGQIATSSDKYKNDILKTIMDTIERIDFQGITTIDITDRLNIRLIYKNKIPLEVGSSLDLEYKIEFLKSVIDEKIEDDFNGKIVMFGNKFAQILKDDDSDIDDNGKVKIITTDN